MWCEAADLVREIFAFDETGSFQFVPKSGYRVWRL
jgi:hypothetical protein